VDLVAGKGGATRPTEACCFRKSLTSEAFTRHPLAQWGAAELPLEGNCRGAVQSGFSVANGPLIQPEEAASPQAADRNQIRPNPPRRMPGLCFPSGKLVLLVGRLLYHCSLIFTDTCTSLLPRLISGSCDTADGGIVLANPFTCDRVSGALRFHDQTTRPRRVPSCSPVSALIPSTAPSQRAKALAYASFGGFMDPFAT
jgi:hypothetical protein